jgi:ketosteroid isomerase-like protein
MMIGATLRSLPTLLLLAAALAGCASQPRSTEADLASIASFNERYLRAINEGDHATLASLTTKEHLMMLPNQPVIAGKDKHDAANKRAAETYRIDETWTPIETVVDRDLAYQRGTYTVKATPRAGGEVRTSEGKFLRIYRRQPDGSWAMTIDSFSSDTPPKPNPN